MIKNVFNVQLNLMNCFIKKTMFLKQNFFLRKHFKSNKVQLHFLVDTYYKFKKIIFEVRLIDIIKILGLLLVTVI